MAPRRREEQRRVAAVIIDCHGHYTTAPRRLDGFRLRPAGAPPAGRARRISDDEIRESLERSQLRIQLERGTDLTLLSPTASAMAHEIGAAAGRRWARTCNDLIHRVCRLYPGRFAGVCQLPQSPGLPPARLRAELKRCVLELGFVGCILNPDPSGGLWRDPPLTDRWWYPLYEEMVELGVPAMIHASASVNPHVHTTGAHYLNADTTAFMQLLAGDLFRDFPGLKLVIPHGGGAVPYHWGRFRSLARESGRAALEELLLGNVYFDTCVYHIAGLEALVRTVPTDNLLFGSEMFGAVQGIDPQTGWAADDTRRLLEAIPSLDAKERAKIFSGNALRVYPRLQAATAAL
jgi:4-oxalmesaconate hydratase